MILINYYISDTHFGWTNKYDGRTLEHDKILKENWNSIVTNADNVYILGDIGKIGKNADTERLIEIIATLKGKKTLIVGNHDSLKDVRLKQLFVEVVPYKEIIDNYNGLNHNLVLSHYPILMWNGQHKGSIHLYGHVHCTADDSMAEHYFKQWEEYYLKPCLAANVGCMKPWMNYTPRTLDEIIAAKGWE